MRRRSIHGSGTIGTFATGESGPTGERLADGAVTRVLVTGASGLVGGRLLAVLARDPDVHVRAASRIARAWGDGVEGVVTDRADAATLAAACKDVDVIVNLASMPERACAEHPAAALHANVGGVLALVQAAAAAGIGRFVQMSTIKVYGGNPSGTITEATPTAPSSHYAITHRAAEDYASLHPCAVVLRLANGFGAPVDPETPSPWTLIVNDFCRQAMTGTIRVHGDGGAWRNFVPLDDVTSALRAAITHVPAGTYNLGSAESSTIRGMADRVARVANATFGLDVEVSVGMNAPTSPPLPLDYRSDRLRSCGVALDARMDDELARTLVCARRTFARAAHD